MPRHITFALALFVSLAAHAQAPRKPPPDEPDTRGVEIEEAHRTSPRDNPENEPRRPRDAEEASAGTSQPPARTPDTRGLEIDEAHRTAPVNKPQEHDDSQ